MADVFEPGDNQSFNEAFGLAEEAGAPIFRWRGDLYKTEHASEEEESAFDYIEAIRNLDEESFREVAWAKQLSDIMQEELIEGARIHGGAASPEADRHRHTVGMWRAAKEIGPARAWIGGAGHEVKNLYDALYGKNLRQLGARSDSLGLGQIVDNSWKDLLNNTIGVGSAVFSDEEDPSVIAGRGYLPADLRSADDSAVTIKQKPGMWAGGLVGRTRYR